MIGGMNKGVWFKKILVLLVLAFWAAPAMAEDAASNYHLDSKDYWKGYLDDGKYLVTAPASFDRYDWYMVGGVLGISAGLYAFDLKLQHFSQENRSDTTDAVSNVFIHAGEELYVFPALFALYVYGDNYDDTRARRTALLSLESWFYSSAVTLGLQQAVHRYTPMNGYYYSVDGTLFSEQNVSFPTSPASTAFAVASVIAGEYDESPYAAPIAYGVATLAGLSSVNNNHNWTSDVFFGAATGYFIGTALVNRHDKESGGKITIIPVINSQNVYILVDFTF
jgi:hypothetical protein